MSVHSATDTLMH